MKPLPKWLTEQFMKEPTSLKHQDTTWWTWYNSLWLICLTEG